MVTEHSRERDPSAQLHEGAFHNIPGIGPGIDKRLHAAGIQTFRQLASLSPEEICSLLNGLVGITSERIAHQDWPGKAGQLAKQVAETEEDPPEPAHPIEPDPLAEPEDPGKRQHYASFMVQLLQDENNAVRRTRVVHIQSNAKDGWAGWNTERLNGWIASQADIPAEQSQQAPIDPRVEIPTPEQQWEVQASFFEPGDSELFAPDSDETIRFLTADQPIQIRIPIRMIAEVKPDAHLLYRAAIEAHPIEGKSFQVTELSGNLNISSEGTTLVIPARGFEPGAYRLETEVLIYPDGSTQPENEGCRVTSKSGLVYVYPKDN